MRDFFYSVVDVFAERALEGNPLAVFHDARSLTDQEMQALARETNLSETTFVLPAEDESNGVRVRIFTAQEELPFAGHPTLGTASWLHWNHATLRGAEEIVLRLNVGPIRVRFAPAVAGEAGVVARMRQNDPVFGAMHERAAIARALGLSVDDLDAEHAPQTVSTGMAFCIVLLRSVKAARRLQISQKDAQEYLDASDAKFFYCVAPVNEGESGAAFHARMQFYNGEDPATGSAAGCCVAWLVRQGLVRSATPTVIEQGVEMKRPSRITGQATFENGKVTDVRIEGRTIPVAEGKFLLP